AVNNGDGTWSLPDNVLSPLAQGAYNVQATATDTVGNTAVDSTINELVIDASVAIVTVNPRVTNDNTPALSGTVDKPTAVVQVTVGGQTLTVTNNGNGTWSLADNRLQPLAD